MRIISPSIEIMRTGLELPYQYVTPEQFIEKVGRTCYKSEDKITDDSAAKFVSTLIKRGHEAMIEHWSLIFKTNAVAYNEFKDDWFTLLSSSQIPVEDRLRPYLRFTDHILPSGEMRFVISGNMRALRDYVKACVAGFGMVPQYLWGMVRNYPLFFPEFQDYVPGIFVNDILIPVKVNELSDEERRIHQDITIKFICDRGVSHEIVRHRVASFAQESTRYCNYGLDKFGQEITVVRPSWCSEADDKYEDWRGGCYTAESSYFTMLADGATPQEARSVLPNSTKTEVIVTMNIDGWSHFFDLRCAPAAHPDMREVARMARAQLEIDGVWKFTDDSSDN